MYPYAEPIGSQLLLNLSLISDLDKERFQQDIKWKTEIGFQTVFWLANEKIYLCFCWSTAEEFQNSWESNFIKNRCCLHWWHFKRFYHVSKWPIRMLYSNSQSKTVPELISANALRAEIFKFSTFVVVAIFQRLHPASTPDWAKRERGLM